MSPLHVDEYHVGIICALPVEGAAARAILDKEHGRILDNDTRDQNAYFAGRIHDHNVVIAHLPAGIDGTTAAASVAKDMVRTFRRLRFGLMVGIGGGIPNLDKGNDIRLGDVVVSQPTDTTGGVVQYDKGKSLDGGNFQRKGSLNAPPSALLTALGALQADHESEDSKVPTYLIEMFERKPKLQRTGYTFPGPDKDNLYCRHPTSDANCNVTCDRCDSASKVCRPSRESTEPQVHYGIIASGNQVVKDAAVRDFLRDDCDALCVEMEAAGLMNTFPCLIIRGICDYADAHKNDAWHKYAATAAAAYTKELLSYVSAEQTLSERPIYQVLGKRQM
jgi:nucleoside phosphorylase